MQKEIIEINLCLQSRLLNVKKNEVRGINKKDVYKQLLTQEQPKQLKELFAAPLIFNDEFIGVIIVLFGWILIYLQSEFM